MPADPPPIPDDRALAGSLDGDFRSARTAVDGVRLHHVTGGRGRPVVLLPGWPQTWWQYRKLMPALARDREVIAVDLRGMGGSDKPEGGYDKRTMAGDVLGLVRALGHQQVDVVGHDIGAMVAQSLAAHHPGAVRRLALLDVLHPDEAFRALPLLPPSGPPMWWFAFNQLTDLPVTVLEGRFRPVIDWMYAYSALRPEAIEESARQVYAHAYGSADAIRAGNGWYQAFGADIEDEQTFPTLEMPVLGLASTRNLERMTATLPRKAADARVVHVEDGGHYLAEEQPERVLAELTAFLG